MIVIIVLINSISDREVISFLSWLDNVFSEAKRHQIIACRVTGADQGSFTLLGACQLPAGPGGACRGALGRHVLLKENRAVPASEARACPGPRSQGHGGGLPPSQAGGMPHNQEEGCAQGRHHERGGQRVRQVAQLREGCCHPWTSP